MYVYSLKVICFSVLFIFPYIFFYFCNLFMYLIVYFLLIVNVCIVTCNWRTSRGRNVSVRGVCSESTTHITGVCWHGFQEEVLTSKIPAMYVRKLTFFT